MVSVRAEPLAPDVAQARLVVGELPHELNEVAGRLRRLCADRVSAVNGGHSLAPCWQERAAGASRWRVRFCAYLNQILPGQSDGKTPSAERQTGRSGGEQTNDVRRPTRAASVAADGRHRRMFAVLTSGLSHATSPNLLHGLSVAASPSKGYFPSRAARHTPWTRASAATDCLRVRDQSAVSRVVTAAKLRVACSRCSASVRA